MQFLDGIRSPDSGHMLERTHWKCVYDWPHPFLSFLRHMFLEARER